MKIFHSYFYRIHFNTQTLIKAGGEEQDQCSLPRVPPHHRGHHRLHGGDAHGGRLEDHLSGSLVRPAESGKVIRYIHI